MPATNAPSTPLTGEEAQALRDAAEVADQLATLIRSATPLLSELRDMLIRLASPREAA
jgi:hypothetical protein